MADPIKLVSYGNLQSYDTLIKKYVNDADAIIDAKSIKTVLVDGDNIKFYKKANATTADTADYTVAISSSDVEQLKTDVAGLKDVVDGYTTKGSIKTAVETAQAQADKGVADAATADGKAVAAQNDVNALKTKVGDIPEGATSTTVTGYVAEAVKALSDGQVTTNKNAIDAINDATTGIAATQKKYTDDEVKKVTDKIGTVADDTTVVAMIADAKKAGTDANSALEAYKTTNDAAVAAAKKAGDDAQADVDALETTVGDMTAVKTTAKTVATAIDELKDAVDATGTAGKVTIADATTPTEGYLKTYVVSQGGTEVGKIDIPKDLVVTAGEVVVDPEGQPAGTYIKLTIANQTNPIFINVKDLVDVYTAAQGATQVQIAISDTNEVSATLVAGGVGTTELADAAVTTAKVADKNITKAKLDESVQASLDAADAAAGALTAAIEALDAEKSQTAGTDGLALSITEVDGKITSISGSIAANTYDAHGAAKAVQDDLDAYKYDVASATDITDLFKDE